MVLTGSSNYTVYHGIQAGLNRKRLKAIDRVAPKRQNIILLYNIISNVGAWRLKRETLRFARPDNDNGSSLKIRRLVIIGEPKEN